MTDVTADTAAAVPARSGPPEGAFRRFLRNPLGMFAATVLLIIVLACVFAPLLTRFGPNDSTLADSMATPNATHPFGADRAGRDLLSRLLYGGRITLLAASLALVISMVVGVPTGLVAGYYGKWVDTTTSWVNNLIMALPAIVVLLAVRSVAGPSVWVSMSVFGLMLAPAFFRLVRSTVADVRNELYVDAARVSGLSDFSIVGKHVLTVVRAPIIIQAALVLSIAIAVQSGLEFLGIGDAQVPTWGALLNDAFRNIYTASWMLWWPGLAIGLTSACLSLFANGVRDALEDRGLNVGRRRRAAAATASPGSDTADDNSADDNADNSASGNDEVEDDLNADQPGLANSTGSSSDGSSSDALLIVRGLGVAYDTPDGGSTEVVSDVNFSVQRGEVLGIVGESGSGKTQTAFAILGLLPSGGRIAHGHIFLGGKDLAEMGRKERTALLGTKIGYIPQEPMSNLDPSYRIGYQLDEPLRVRLGLSRADAKAKSLALLARVGIPDPERTYRAYPYEVSGGMAQRVLIAGAVSCDPELLIADEATTALDVTVQAEVLDLLRDLQNERDMGVILVTHNFGVVADICDRVVVMQNGHTIETGEVEDIFARPAHPYTQMLIGSTLEGSELRAPVRAHPVGTDKTDKEESSHV